MGEETKTHSKLWEYWQTNVRTNYKKISAIFGSMIIMVLGLVLYGHKADLDLSTILMTIVFAMQPFLTVLINIMFKGESELKDRQIDLLKQELISQRDLTEYKLKVIALKATADWDKYNDLIADIELVKRPVKKE